MCLSCRSIIAGVVSFASTLFAIGQDDLSSPRIKGWFNTTTISIAYDEQPGSGAGLDEFLVAIGPVNYVPNPTWNAGSGSGTITWSDRTLGEVFRAIQAFPFPAGSTIALTNVSLGSWGSGFPPASELNIYGHRIFNFSARAEVGRGEKVTIGGMIPPGEYPRLVAFKVLGPSLEAFGIDAPLADPKLDLFEGGQLVLTNDDHTTLRTWERNYLPLVCPAPEHPTESMIVTFLDPGQPYTAIVSGADDGTGVALLEMYMLDAFYIE